MRRITGVLHTDDKNFIAKNARSQSKEVAENDKKSTNQSKKAPKRATQKEQNKRETLEK